jgi:hypothetical protein
MVYESKLPSESPEPPSNSEPSRIEVIQEPSSVALKVAFLIFVLVAGLAAGYGWIQHDAARRLATERQQLSDALAQAKSEADALTVKVNALSAAQAEAQAQNEAARAQAEPVKNEQFPPRPTEVRRHRTHQAVARSAPVDDPRWKQVQQQLGDQQKALADTQQQIASTQANLEQAKSDLNGNLESARTQLGGDIARNHDELVALEKKGERTYYEFSFEKSPTYHHTGPISIALRKADAKHEYCDLQMVVDDKSITRKHINLYESVTLHPAGYAQPLELVINRIDKDSVKGYVSEPKVRSTEQAAAPATPPTTAAVNSPGPTAPEAKLEHRPDSPQ